MYLIFVLKKTFFSLFFAIFNHKRVSEAMWEELLFSEIAELSNWLASNTDRGFGFGFC